MSRVTKINKLEMKGFKSFNKKTTLVFGGGYNCVLGPNGAGKSNVFDALIFVLGKSGSKGMRAEKTANLIYNGGKSKEPARQAEVAIWFDNSKDVFGTGTEEVEIRRVLGRDGSSKYYINGKQHTRQQVLELLSKARIDPDSHNIVLQGDIVGLVEMSPLERRGMIEEVAGISIYESKKEKALRELGRVEEKLNEAGIILAERKTYLKELEKEKEQALRFKELNEKIKRNKATLLALRIEEKKASLARNEEALSKLQERIKALEEDANAARIEIESLKEEAERVNKEIEEKGEKEQVELHKKVEELRVESALKKERINVLQSELKKLEERKAQLSSDLEELLARLESLRSERKAFLKRVDEKKKEAESLAKALAEKRAKHNLGDAEEVDKRIEAIDSEADSLQAELHSLREEQQALLREKDKAEVQLQGIDEKIERVLELEKENKESLEALKKAKEELSKVSSELEGLLSKDSELALELENAKATLQSRREAYSKLKAESASLSESVARGLAVKEVLKLRNSWHGIHGTIAELGSADQKYALALEIAAGGRVSSVVVESDEVAEKCIKHLREKKLGVATFLPLNKLRPKLVSAEARSLKGKGVHGLALDLVEFDSKFEKAFQHVFGNTLIVEDIATARRIGIGRVRMVTLQGDLIDSSGAMQGGYRSKERTGFAFQSKELLSKLKALEAEIEDLEKVVSRLEAEREGCEDSIEALRLRKSELEGEIIKVEKSLHFDSADLEATKEKKKELQSELGELENSIRGVEERIVEKTKALTRLKVEKQKLREKISSLRNPVVLAEINSLEEKRNELLREVAAMEAEAKTYSSEENTILLPEKESLEKVLKQHEKEEKDFEEEKKKLEKELRELESTLKKMEAEEKKFYSKFKELFEKRQRIAEKVNSLEDRVLKKNEESRSLELKSHSLSLEVAKLKAELAGLEEEFKDYDGVPVYKDKDEKVIRKEIEEFERMASELGAVNMKALEIYDQVEQEYKSLLEKKEKLALEREDVLVMINKIDAKKKELFMKSFNELNKNFKDIFSKLTTKGEAELELEDKKDPFAGGVTIRVKITGKKFLDIRGLSGGEKTLTALAFLFAVQEYEPASFYVFDEVDAALDKRNSEKLAAFFKVYSERSQYIIISHNDAVISEADNLYGVSMNKDGESKVTTLKV